MGKKLPAKLGKEPILEAIWEVRFGQRNSDVVSPLLPGILYRELGKQYPKLERLPFADFPLAVAQVEPYAPLFRLEGAPSSPFAIQVGNRMVSLNNRRPYRGWAEFSERIRKLLALLESLNLIQEIERFSLRYLDLIELDSLPGLDSLDIDLIIATHNLKKEKQPIQLRTEIKEEPFVHTLQIVAPVTVTLRQGEQLTGTLIDIDTVYTLPLASWTEVGDHLDEAHVRSKALFFNLLTLDALKLLDPIYIDENTK